HPARRRAHGEPGHEVRPRGDRAARGDEPRRPDTDRRHPRSRDRRPSAQAPAPCGRDGDGRGRGARRWCWRWPLSPFDLLRFAAGSFRGHRLRTILSVIGVAIGVSSVMVLTSLGEGARGYITGEFMSLGSNLLIVLPRKTENQGEAPIFIHAPHDLTLAGMETMAPRSP